MPPKLLNDSICGRLTGKAQSIAASIPTMKQKRTIAHATVPRVRDNGHVQRLVPDSPFGGWLRTPSMQHISHCNYVPTAISKLRNERSPIVPQAILVGDQHASLPAMVLSLSDPSTPPFFFPSSGAPKGAPLQRRRKEYFFWWVWRGGDGRCNVPFDKALRRSNAVQLGSGPEGQGERHS